MKRYGKTEQLWERICAEENIEKAMRASLIKHKYPHMKTADYSAAQKYMLEHWDECKETVRRTLTTERYEFQKLHSFTVYEPKERIIHCPQHHPDKIIMICAYQVLRDYFYKKFVRNTYNCIKGRGIHDAKRAIERIQRNHPDWYYVQTDIRKFYPTLRHDIIKAELRRVFKDQHVIRLLDAIVDIFHEGIDEEGHEIGIAIGVNLSQLLAILVNNPVLREINEKWKYPAVNFTDDNFIAVPTKEAAHEFVEWYIARCASRGMTVKPNYRIAPMTTPVRMIGYEFRVDKEGHQHTLLSKPIKIRMKRRARQLEKRKELADEDWKQQMASYYGWCKHAKCKHLMRKVFKEKYELFTKDKMKSLAEIKKSAPGEFGLPKDNFVSVLDIINTELEFKEVKDCKPFKEDNHGRYQTDGREREKRVAVRFSYPGEETEHYTITGSESLVDRLNEVKHEMPFTARIVTRVSARRKEYYAIE